MLLPPVPDADTGFDVALTDAGGERTFITAVGAEAQLTADRLAGVVASSSDAVHVSGYSLVHAPSRNAIAGWLARLPPECVVLVDPGPLWRGIPAAVLATVGRRATWWSCNLTEATELSAAGEGHRLAESRLAESRLAEGLEAARRLAAASRAEGPPGMGVVVRLGAAGCVILVPEGEPVHVPGFAVEVLDSNGAGDAHVGAFLAALAAGQHPVDAARRANACAALAVTRTGPATAPTSVEVDALLASGA